MSGARRCARWTRIWWVRPVSSSHSTRAALVVRARTRMRVWAERPPAATTMRRRSRLWRAMGSSMSRLPSWGSLGEWRTRAR